MNRKPRPGLLRFRALEIVVCLTPDELHLGLCMTLIEDTPALLASALASQAEIEGRL